MTTQLKTIQSCGQKNTIPIFPLSHIVDVSPEEEYFTYLGKVNQYGNSYGISQWIVFTKTRGVSEEQVLKNNNAHELSDYLFYCT